MDKAYRKVKSKNGVLERLNEISKFYELAVMQLEGCLKFVQEEADNYVLESGHEILLEDLTEIRDRLQGRLKEVELAISEKDRELAERLANEFKHRKALEKELDSLHADLKCGKRKNEGIGELFLGTQASTESGDREGEFCELKNSVDQQVLNIQQQLEPNYQHRDEERNQVIDNKKIEQMGSDISILKETMDLAFCKMQNAICLSELGPMEHQWMWNIERSTVDIVIKGFMKDFQQNFEDQVKKREMQFSFGLKKQLSDVMRQMTSLSQELEFHTNQDEVQVNISNPKGFPKTNRRCLSEGDFGDSNNFLMEVEETNTNKKPCAKDSGDDGGNYVAKMIKNHESIIRRKSAEIMIPVKPEILREKGCPSFKKEYVNLKRRIPEVIVSLESLNCNPGIGHTFGECRYNYDVEKPSDHPVSSFTADMMDIKESGIESMEEIWAKVNKPSVSHVRNEEKCDEMRRLRQEMEDANLQTMIMEQTYLTLFKSLAEEFHTEMLNRVRNEEKREMRRLRQEMEDTNLQAMMMEQMYLTLFRSLAEEFHTEMINHHLQCLIKEALMSIKDDVWKLFLAEMIKEWEMKIDCSITESSIREEWLQFVIAETVKEACISEEADDQNQETSIEEHEKENIVTLTLHRLVKFLEEEEVLLLSACSEIKEQKMRLDLVCSVFDDLDGHKVVVKLTEKNFSSFIGENDYVMVYFGYPSDPRSRKLASRYEAAAATLSKDGEVAFAKVDFLTDKDLYLKYKLSGNPRVILFSGGNRKVYDGCGTRDDIVRWVRKNAAGVPIITQKDDAEQLLASDSMKVVGFYDSLESEDSKELYIASKLRPDLKFYQITDPEIAKMFRINPEIKHPVLIQLRKEDEDFRQFAGHEDFNEDIAEFYSQNLHVIKQPVINEKDQKAVVSLTEKNFSSFIAENEYVMVIFYEPCSYWSQTLALQYEAAAATLVKNDRFAFAKVDATTEMELATEYRICPMISGDPMVLLFADGVLKSSDVVRTRNDIERLIQEISTTSFPNIITENDDAEHLLTEFNGERFQVIKQPVLNQKGEAVVTLTWENFSSFIAENEFVMVNFYTTWCGWSQELAPVYEAAAATMKDDGVAFAQVDCVTEYNLAMKYHISGYPSMFLFAGGVRKYYDGERTRNDIVRWVRKNTAGIPTITEKDDAQHLLATDFIKVVGFYDTLEGPDSKELLFASKLRPDLNFYQTTSPEIAKIFHINPEIKHPVLVQLGSNDEDFKQFVGSFTGSDIANFLSSGKPLYTNERVAVVSQYSRKKSSEPGVLDQIFSSNYGDTDTATIMQNIGVLLVVMLPLIYLYCKWPRLEDELLKEGYTLDQIYSPKYDNGEDHYVKLPAHSDAASDPTYVPPVA
ncbi:Thioredoxin-like protein [Corchorus olitorius]|uniref:Thioredoxin-like protein n=1 Tax=Corchorus olitorius TaxID=93759 RepID=A0A1R3IFM2_9ROSI|nr:Thioredoxin-like protein [Corchorus olitorius]